MTTGLTLTQICAQKPWKWRGHSSRMWSWIPELREHTLPGKCNYAESPGLVGKHEGVCPVFSWRWGKMIIQEFVTLHSATSSSILSAILGTKSSSSLNVYSLKLNVLIHSGWSCAPWPVVVSFLEVKGHIRIEQVSVLSHISLFVGKAPLPSFQLRMLGLLCSWKDYKSSCFEQKAYSSNVAFVET